MGVGDGILTNQFHSYREWLEDTGREEREERSRRPATIHRLRAGGHGQTKAATTVDELSARRQLITAGPINCGPHPLTGIRILFDLCTRPSIFIHKNYIKLRKKE